MKFVVSEKESPHGMLLVVTDQTIIGKKFEEGRLQLDLTKDFYRGEEKEKQDLPALFQKARHFHLTGKEIINFAVEFNYVFPERILWISDVPHAQTVAE